MKNTFLLSFSLVAATASVALGSVAFQYSDILYSVVPCVFLLLLASGEYSRKSRPLTFSEASTSVGSGKQSLRLAA
jgi:hypothetical protein